MVLTARSLLGRAAPLTDRLRLPSGRRHRRSWVGGGHAHVEVRGADDPARADMVRALEAELAALRGVRWAAVNGVTGRVVVDFDETRRSLDDLVAVIERVEASYGLEGEQFPDDRPEHPADVEPLQRQALALAADVAGLGLGLIGKLVRINPLSAELASLVSVVDATPALRRPLESRVGHAVADLGLAVGNAVAQGLTQGPIGLAVDMAQRALLLDEIRGRRTAWERREAELHQQPESARAAAMTAPARPVPLRDGPVETYAGRAVVAAVGGAVVTGVAARDPRLVVAATVAATPKAARLGREAFAATLGCELASSGVLAMDADVLRRLDRVDIVVLDADALTTKRVVITETWADPAQLVDSEAAQLVAHSLLDGHATTDVIERDGWLLRPARDEPGSFGSGSMQALRGPGRRVLTLESMGVAVALVAVEAELDPLAESLVAAARGAGDVVIGGSGLHQRLHAQSEVPGGAGLAASVRALQADGACVAVVSDRQPEALAAADVAIGFSGVTAPWGADLITPAGLAGACQVLRSVPAAKLVSRRAAAFSAYGSGVGAALALVGPRRGATARALVGVNGAAVASLGQGFLAARALGRRPAPLPVDATNWHALAGDAVLQRLATTAAGLPTDSEVRRRLASRPVEAGRQRIGLVRASLDELVNPLTPVLASGAGLAAATGAVSDAGLIGAVMGLNAVLGGIQRVGAERALQRLVHDSAVRVRVRREHGEVDGTADDLVVGDVVVVGAGDAIPADCRVLEAHGLEVDEASLTGESQLVTKSAAATAAASVADRRSMLYAGTSVAAGRAVAVVVAVGPSTEVGRSTADLPEHRPGGVEARLRRLTTMTVPVALGAGAAVVGAGLLHGRRLAASVGTGVSLAVAAVPEGLPLVATVAQLAAARRLSHRNTLVRNPATIEALGRIDVLCFDKTGTLTEGRIRLHQVVVEGSGQSLRRLDVDGRRVLAAGLRASPEHRDGERPAQATDRAIIEGGRAARTQSRFGVGHWHAEAELPFESSRGFHAVLGRTAVGYELAVKGAPEVVIPLCVERIGIDGAEPLDDRARRQLAEQADALARRGFRVLAVAARDASGRQDLDEERVQRLRFIGLLGLTDPVRESAARAVQGIRAAGVDVIMLTGDHPSTAEAIAADLDMLNDGRIMTGPELDRLADDELDAVCEQVTVFARVTPTHKARIVAALQRRGRVVAVTGDGANDAPAIRLAHVGIALGLRGTNAAKEAADVVVLDDRIETITDAIVEGRAMWVSVRDAIAVLLGGNLGEVLFTVGSGLALRRGSPLNARQLLLVNLFTDLVPSMALAVRPPPRTDPARLLREGPDASLGAALTRDVVLRGVVTAGAGAGAWLGGRVTGITAGRAGTVALVGLVGAQLGQTLAVGSHSPLVIAASLGSAAALVAIIQTPGVSQFFGCRPLGPVGWTVGVSAAGAATIAAPVLARLLALALPADTPSPGKGDVRSGEHGEPERMSPPLVPVVALAATFAGPAEQEEDRHDRI